MNNRIGSPDSSSSAEDVKPLKKMAEEIKVVIRVRPLNDRETNPSFIKPSTGLRCWRVLNEHNAITQTLNDGITPLPEKISGRTIFTYDKVFGEKSTTRDIYDYAARGIVSMAVGGRNGSIFAYGQTSSGKTHTMQGSSTISKSGGGVKDGFVHLAADDLFHKISEQQGRDFKIQVSVIEVYNEDVRDLLVDPRSRKQKDNLLKIRENPQKGIFVDAVKKEAGSLSKLLSILSTGEKNRIVAKTTLNKRSSRSHLIFCIMLTSKPNNKGNGNGRPMSIEKLETSQVSTLNLIDLAGSESVRHRSSHSNEDRRKEGGNINKR
jgi:centromeric protein E